MLLCNKKAESVLEIWPKVIFVFFIKKSVTADCWESHTVCL